MGPWDGKGMTTDKAYVMKPLGLNLTSCRCRTNASTGLSWDEAAKQLFTDPAPVIGWGMFLRDFVSQQLRVGITGGQVKWASAAREGPRGGGREQ